QIVDLTHAVPPQDVCQGALVLAQTARWFPPGTLHVAVVDPGVGTARRIIYAEIGDQRFLGPDNGLFSRLALACRPTTIIAVTRREHWLPEVSHTFHGRDIMAPVAARLTLGLEPRQLGERITELVMLPWSEVCVKERKITGQVASIDSFGNLITDISAAT